MNLMFPGQYGKFETQKAQMRRSCQMAKKGMDLGTSLLLIIDSRLTEDTLGALVSQPTVVH